MQDQSVIRTTLPLKPVQGALPCSLAHDDLPSVCWLYHSNLASSNDILLMCMFFSIPKCIF